MHHKICYYPKCLQEKSHTLAIGFLLITPTLPPPTITYNNMTPRSLQSTETSSLTLDPSGLSQRGFPPSFKRRQHTFFTTNSVLFKTPYAHITPTFTSCLYYATQPLRPRPPFHFPSKHCKLLQHHFAPTLLFKTIGFNNLIPQICNEGMTIIFPSPLCSLTTL